MEIKQEKVMIDRIPAIIWGEKSDQVYVHVHGKMSAKEYAESFSATAEKHGFQTLSFDLPEHGERKDEKTRCDIWNGMKDLEAISDYAFGRWESCSLFACSLGAYFSLNTYADKKFDKCLFQSPIVDMNYMIERMFEWFGITEEKLRREGEIQTPVDTMTWNYYMYVKEHPLNKWEISTSILYGGKDNMQSPDVIHGFAEKYHCRLTVSENSAHPFMEKGDTEIFSSWLDKEI